MTLRTELSQLSANQFAALILGQAFNFHVLAITKKGKWLRVIFHKGIVVRPPPLDKIAVSSLSYAHIWAR